MRLVFISDTHGKHEELSLPAGDVLLHCGDLSGRGYASQLQEFLDWFSAQEHPHKVFIAGNHDFLCEKDAEQFASMIPGNCTYLNDSGISIEGLRIWGSPVQPWFYDWAFNRQRGADIQKHWDLIPRDTEVLLTHGPPMNLLDLTARGKRVGCEDLRKQIEDLPDLRIHAFGHIHEAFGQVMKKEVLYLNASVLDLQYQCVFPPTVVDWDAKKRQATLLTAPGQSN